MASKITTANKILQKITKKFNAALQLRTQESSWSNKEIKTQNYTNEQQ